MQMSSRFTAAVHMMLCMDYFGGQGMKVTSEFMAGSVGVNPVIVRQLLQKLKAADLVTVKRGSGGAEVAKPLDEISFLDVYRAVDIVNKEDLFHFHENPNGNCPVGGNIHNVLDDRLQDIQNVFEQKLASISLADVRGTLGELTEG